MQGFHSGHVFPFLVQPILSLLAHLCNKSMDDRPIMGDEGKLGE